MSVTVEQMKSDFNKLALIFKEYNPKIDSEKDYYSSFRVMLNPNLELWINFRSHEKQYTIGSNAYFNRNDKQLRETQFAIESKAKDSRLISKINQLIPEFKEKANNFVTKQQKLLNEENAHNAKKRRIMKAISPLRDISTGYNNNGYHLQSGDYQKGTKVKVDDYLGQVSVKLVGLTEEQAIHILQYFHSQNDIQ